MNLAQRPPSASGRGLMMESLLVANRGEIARRVMRTARRLGIRTVAVYSEPDAELPFAREADAAVLIGPAHPAESYLSPERLLDAARSTGAQAVHPGYGFLSENPRFAEQVRKAGLVWVGPTPESIAGMGDKVAARNRASDAGVPVVPGTRDPVHDVQSALAAASHIGYPVIVKSVAGGGGIGMGVADSDASLERIFETARSRAAQFFGDPAVLLERYLAGARHVEVQILGQPNGCILALGERDCSAQRRFQKIAEETPSPAVSDELRSRLFAAAVRVGEVAGYCNAGTVECLVVPQTQEFFFLEMNTRLQVEHPVTELVTGLDLVEQQLRIASGIPATAGERPTRGHAIELRVYAEDPVRFLPSPGTITAWVEPRGDGIRVDAGYASGNTVTPFYDPLLAKLCVFGDDRADALQRARLAVKAFVVEGPKTNLPFLAELLDHPDFVSGNYDTSTVASMRPR
jgi:acetyl-CoA carboxylase, biotin carboxylase subunit